LDFALYIAQLLVTFAFFAVRRVDVFSAAAAAFGEECTSTTKRHLISECFQRHHCV
jgi:hypothetical protein